MNEQHIKVNTDDYEGAKRLVDSLSLLIGRRVIKLEAEPWSVKITHISTDEPYDIEGECPPRKIVRLSDNKEMIKGLRQLQRDNQRVSKFADVTTSAIANVAVFFIKLWRAVRTPLKSLVNEWRLFNTEVCKFAWWLIKCVLFITAPFIAASLFLEWAGGVNAWYVIQCIVWLIIMISAFEWARGGGSDGC